MTLRVPQNTTFKLKMFIPYTCNMKYECKDGRGRGRRMCSWLSPIQERGLPPSICIPASCWAPCWLVAGNANGFRLRKIHLLFGIPSFHNDTQLLHPQNAESHRAGGVLLSRCQQACLRWRKPRLKRSLVQHRSCRLLTILRLVVVSIAHIPKHLLKRRLMQRPDRDHRTLLLQCHE